MPSKVTIPNTFATATTAIPLSQLDGNFSNVNSAINNALTYSNYAVDTGTANTYTISITGQTTTYAAGIRFQFKALNTNTGASTLNVNAQGAQSIVTTTGAALAAGAIAANAIVDVMYDGTNFQLMSDSGSGSETFLNLTVTGTTNTANLIVTSTATFAAGSNTAPSITTSGDTNTGIFFPAADTIGIATGGTERVRIDSNANGVVTVGPFGSIGSLGTNYATHGVWNTAGGGYRIYRGTGSGTSIAYWYADGTSVNHMAVEAVPMTFGTNGTERMRIDSSGNVGIGTSSPISNAGYGGLSLNGTSGALFSMITNGTESSRIASLGDQTSLQCKATTGFISFVQGVSGGTERARITSGGDFLVAKTSSSSTTVGCELLAAGLGAFTANGGVGLLVNRLTNDGTLVSLRQDSAEEGTISVSGNTVSYNSFAGGHWTQLQEGRGYNPEILRGTVMSSIGEMSEWKSVTWTETIEHPAIPAVEAKEAVVDEEGNVIEPAVEAVEGKDAWTESINKRNSYLGNLPIGATFEEDGFTKTVVDDGNERLPKVKISDVVGDKAVYGVFQTYDEVQDMLITSLGAFVVRIASGVTVQIGDLLESNGDGCAKVQDDDVIRSKTIGKVTSTVATATYDDGSYTVPCVIYCG